MGGWRFAASAGAAALLASLSCAREPPSEQAPPRAAASTDVQVARAATPARAANRGDAAFEAFSASVAKAARVDEEALDPTEVQRRSDQLRDYSEERAQALLNQLDPEARPRVAGPVGPAAFGNWSPFWSRLVERAVMIDDAAHFAPGASRRASAMRADLRSSQSASLSVEGLYRLDRFVQHGPGELAEHLLFARSRGETGKRARAELTAIYTRALVGAPEAASADDSCRRCVLADQDLDKLLRNLRAFETESQNLADAQCGAWPELTAVLGGTEPCREAFDLYVSSLAGGDGLAEQARSGGPPDLTNEPPARDAAYARFAAPIRDGCVGEGVDDANRHPEIERCFAGELNRRMAKLRTRAARSHLRFSAAWATFQSDLCEVEALIEKDSSMFGADRSYRHCSWLAPLRAAFVLDVWQRDAVAELKAHVHWREPWAQSKVLPGLSRLQRLAARPACPRTDRPPKSCRTSAEPARSWTLVSPAIDRLEPDASKLARVTCDEWRGAAALFGAECRAKLSRYYLSYAQNIGKVTDLTASAR
jgi:hypothetical protein